MESPTPTQPLDTDIESLESLTTPSSNFLKAVHNLNAESPIQPLNTERLNSLLKNLISQFIDKFNDDISPSTGLPNKRSGLEDFIRHKFFQWARADSFKIYEIDTAEEVGEVFRSYEKILLYYCIEERRSFEESLKSVVLNSISGNDPLNPDMSSSRKYFEAPVESLKSMLEKSVSMFIIKYFQDEFPPGYLDIGRINKRLQLVNFIRRNFIEKARVDGIEISQMYTNEEVGELFSRYEVSLLQDCIEQTSLQMKGSVKAKIHPSFIQNAQILPPSRFDRGYFTLSPFREPCSNKNLFIQNHGLVDDSIARFVDKYHNIIDYFLMHHQYDNTLLPDFIKQKLIDKAEDHGLKNLSMGSPNIVISNMFTHFEQSLLRDCIQEIQKGPLINPTTDDEVMSIQYEQLHPIQKEFIKDALHVSQMDALNPKQKNILKALINFFKGNRNTEDQMSLVPDEAFVLADSIKINALPEIPIKSKEENNDLDHNTVQIIVHSDWKDHIDQRKTSSESDNKFMADIIWEVTVQAAGVVLSYAFTKLSSLESLVVLKVVKFSVLVGTSCTAVGLSLRKRNRPLSNVLTKFGFIATASSIILSFAALLPMVAAWIFGTLAYVLLAVIVAKS